MPGIAIGGLAGSTATTVHHGCGCEGRGERQRQTGLVNGFVEYVTEGSSSPEARPGGGIRRKGEEPSPLNEAGGILSCSGRRGGAAGWSRWEAEQRVYEGQAQAQPAGRSVAQLPRWQPGQEML